MGGPGGDQRTRQWLRRVAVAIVVAAIGAAGTVAHARGAAPGAAGSVVFVEGKPVALDDPVQIVNGTLMVPVRLFEALDVRIGWEAATKTAVLRKGELTVRLQVGSRYAMVEGRRLPLPEPPALVEGRLMVPLRAAAEALGYVVKWDARLGRVNLMAPTEPAPTEPARTASMTPPAPSSPGGAGPGTASARAAVASKPAQAAVTSTNAAPPPTRATPYVPSPRPDPPGLSPSRDELLAALLAVLPPARLPDDTLFAQIAMAAKASAGVEKAAATPPSSVATASPSTPPTSGVTQAPAAEWVAPAASMDRQTPLAQPEERSASQAPALPPAPTRPPGPASAPAPVLAAPAPAPPANAPEAKPAGPASPMVLPQESAPAAPKPAAQQPELDAQATAGQATASDALGEVTGVTVRREGGRARIDIVSEGPVKLRAAPIVLADPPRLVLDLERARLGAANVDYPANGALVKGIRLAQHAPDVVRVAVDLMAAVGFRVEEDPEGGRLSVLLNHAVSAVYWVWGADGRGQLWVEMSGMAAVRTATLSDPLRLLVDIQQATLVGNPGEWEVSTGPVRRFRVSQFQPDVVRVVLELAQPIRPRIVTSLDLTRALLDPGSDRPASPPGDVDLVLDVYSRITGVAIRPMGPQGAAVVVQATAPIEPRAFYLRNPGRLVLDLPGAVVDPSLDKEELEPRASVGPALSVRVGQFLPRSARVVVELRQPVGYQFFSADERETLILALGDRPLTGRTVAIDAGHGGFDPGAIGVSGTPEKVYNLDIAQRLARLLESVGIEVAMTRRGDSFVPLDERVAMAVRAGADIFVSVHNNASTSRGAVGTEVFYSPNHPASQRLAELLYDALLDKLSRAGRGVRMRRDLRVLRLAPMPAALVEVAFVDHPDDEGRLRDPAFRQQAAEAMFTAIVSFLSQVGNNTVEATRMPVAR